MFDQKDKETQRDIILNLTGIKDIDLHNIYPYGSRIYGTASEWSDHDFLVVADGVTDNQQLDSRDGSISCHVFTPEHWQELLNKHKISQLECHFLPTEPILIRQEFEFLLDHPTLRAEISAKASHSFVKAKKKLLDGEHRLGLKSLFHSLRIPMFGIQIAQDRMIHDYTVANRYHKMIMADFNEGHKDWAWYKHKYQPIHNEIMSEFRTHAGKGKP